MYFVKKIVKMKLTQHLNIMKNDESLVCDVSIKNLRNNLNVYIV